ncbi:hypothetical protein TrVE_jg6043 [Triparma verrucosa]|uniref:Uncharacterized protein n=1 Tax=Triparma verrucosa TaxID=1606542 RepID=A0A9W7FML1_9STRA|nr:hypothetical protein TrVE_jg6043 [Triparma verrucosa]
MALVLVAKYPTPGKSKTRLSAAVGSSETHNLANAFLLDTLCTLSNVELQSHTVNASQNVSKINKYVLYAPRSAEKKMRSLVNEAMDGMDPPLGRDEWTLLPMVDADGLTSSQLTVKLKDGLEQVRSIEGDGAPVAFVGMDSPTLTSAEVAQSLEVAAKGKSYIKPAKDNGYVLITLSGRVDGAVFEGVRWSCDETFSSQARRLCAFGEVVVGEPGFDIDEIDDLEELYKILKADEEGKEFKLTRCRAELQKYEQKKLQRKKAKDRATWLLWGMTLLGIGVAVAVGKGRTL